MSNTGSAEVEDCVSAQQLVSDASSVVVFPGENSVDDAVDVLSVDEVAFTAYAFGGEADFVVGGDGGDV